MAQKAVEMILLRQVASYLATPIFIVDEDGTLLYYNEAAEQVLGRRFEETGEMPAEEWRAAFRPVDEDGAPLPAESLPLLVALRDGHPALRSFRIVGLDGGQRRIEVAAVPLVGQGGRRLGAIAFFREQAEEDA